MFDDRPGVRTGTAFGKAALDPQQQQQQHQLQMQAVVFDPYRRPPKTKAEIHVLSAHRPAAWGQKDTFRGETVLLTFKPRS